MNIHHLHFVATDTLPAVASGLDTQPCDTGPARFGVLGSVEWGALIEAEFVNGCGPKGLLGEFVPDCNAKNRAAALLHDMRYLMGGTNEDRARADAEFATHGPVVYAVAVNALGQKFFVKRERPLNHSEMLVIVQAAYYSSGFSACCASMPSPNVMFEIQNQLQ